ncbi:MAG: hypothetical protein AB9921_00090 [Erysipelotrichaceae bacterium]
MSNRNSSSRKKSITINYFTGLVILTVLVVLLSPVLVYSITYIISHLKPELLSKFRVGDAESWIQFSGAIIGGSMTLFAVVFSLRHNEILYEKQKSDAIKPIFSFSPTLKNEGSELIQTLTDFDSNFRIELEALNISNNPALDFKITDIVRKVKDKEFSLEASNYENEMDDIVKNEHGDKEKILGNSAHIIPIYFYDEEGEKSPIRRNLELLIKYSYRDINLTTYSNSYRLLINIAKFHYKGKLQTIVSIGNIVEKN